MRGGAALGTILAMSSPQPGWYINPENNLEERLWDGESWTERTRARRPQVAPSTPVPRPAPQPAPLQLPSAQGATAWPVPAPQQSPWVTGPAGTQGGWVPPREAPLNGMAIASLVLSLVPFLLPFLGAVLAVIFGHIALAQTAHPNPQGVQQRGRGFAVAGTIIGWVEVVLFLAVLASIE